MANNEIEVDGHRFSVARGKGCIELTWLTGPGKDYGFQVKDAKASDALLVASAQQFLRMVDATTGEITPASEED